MPPARLRLKIIKDARVGALDGTDQQSVQMRVLDMSMLPFTLYVRIQIPPAREDPQQFFLHLIGRPTGTEDGERFFAATNVPEAPPAEAPEVARRILLVLMGEDIPIGRYRLALVCNRQHVAVVDVVKHENHLRVVTRPPASQAAEISAVLISGTHKSGTTWLEKIVDAHIDFAVLHEANTFNIFDPAGLRRLVAERQQHFQYRNYIRWLNPAFDVDDFSHFLQISLARELILRLGRAWGSRYVADRTPGYSGLYVHLCRFWEDLRILHIVRHPLDVLASRLFHEANLDRTASRATAIAGPMLQSLNDRLDTGMALQPGEFVSDADAAGETLGSLLRNWRQDQDHYLAASCLSASTFHLVKYEDLAKDFQMEAGCIFAFIGTDPARTDLAAIARRTTFETLSGGRSAGQADARSFFRKGISGDWRNVFSPAQAVVLWQRVSATASSFGYALD